MKVLVTGATGFLGCNLVHHLVERGDEVRVLRRTKSSVKLLENLSVETATGDVTDAASVMTAAAGVEGIYHVAGLISFWKPKRAQQYLVNVDGTRNVIEAATKNRVRRLVHTSSVATIGIGTGGQADETVEWNCDH